MVKRRAANLDVANLFRDLSRRLGGELEDECYGQEENVGFLLDLVKRTVEKGESNSLLILGPHGSGKTALVRKVINEASKCDNWLENVLLVELNGLLQTDDKLALKEITRQLHLENVVGDRIFGSFADHLSFLLTSLKVGDRQTSKPIIFTLEEFDMFCSHRNQTLLYNLFDTAQSRAVPICVLGISCQIDVTELLEKRVNSRFSHRHINMLLFSDFAEYYKLTARLLKLDEDAEDSTTWNSHVEATLKKKEIAKFFNKVFEFDKTITFAKRVLYLTLLNMAEKNENELSLAHLEAGLEATGCTLSSDPIASTVRDLSILEICLLIAVKHICEIYDNEPFNFEMVYHEFIKFKRRKFSTLPEERSVVFKCWENLLNLEFILPKAGVRTQGQQLEYILNSFHLPSAVLSKSIEKYPNCPTEVLQWCSSSLHTLEH